MRIHCESNADDKFRKFAVCPLTYGSFCGPEESRTPYLIIASDALYQLSYKPVEAASRAAGGKRYHIPTPVSDTHYFLWMSAFRKDRATSLGILRCLAIATTALIWQMEQVRGNDPLTFRLEGGYSAN